MPEATRERERSDRAAPDQQVAVGIPQAVLDVVEFASPGYGPSWPVHGATGATAGTPGSFTGGTTPANAAEANAEGVKASPATAWTTGQWVQGSTAGAPGEMSWNGTTWVAGRVP